MKKLNKKRKSEKSQVTIFVIIGLIIIVSIALIWVLVKKPAGPIILSAVEDPQAYIESCMTPALENTVNEMIASNLYPNLTENYILANLGQPGEKVPYLCKASQFYKPCINQEPMLPGYIKNKISELMNDKVEGCFNNLQSSLKSKDYKVTKGEANFTIIFEGKSIIAQTERHIRIEKADDVRIYNKFSAKINSPLYSLIDTARNIVNYESTLCNFDSVNWMRAYHDITINRFLTSDQTKIYTLTDGDSEKKIRFAVKTCTLPAGI